MKFTSIIILISSLFSQSSILYLNGYGERSYSDDPASISVGGMWFFSGRDNNITLNATSSLWHSNLSRISMHNSYESIWSEGYNTQSNHSIDLLNFTFPFKKSNAITIGISPYTKSNLLIFENTYSLVPGAENSNPFAYKNKYDFIGGISQFYMGLSKNISTNFSFGIRWNKLFGIQKTYHTIYTYTISFDQYDEATFTLNDSTNAIITNKFNGSSIDIDGRYHNNTSIFAWLVSLSLPINIQKTENMYDEGHHNYLYNVPAINETMQSNQIKISRYGLGYHGYITNDMSYMLEYHSINRINHENKYMILNQQDEGHFSLQNPVS